MEKAKKTRKSSTSKTSKPRAPRKKKQEQKHGGNKLTIIIISVVIVLTLAGGAVLALNRYTGPDAWVNIPANASREAIADTLRARLGTTEGNRVFALWRFAGGSPETARGSYKVTHGQTSFLTAWRLRGGRQTPVKVAWTDVRTLPQLAEKVSARFQFTPAEFLTATDSVLKQAGYDSTEYAAAFIPDTYEFYATSTAASVVKKLLEYRDKFWNNKRTADARSIGLTPIEAATLASIVEEESSKADELPVIARLYLNRLDKDMPLQADPTVKFATGNFALRRITSEHLKIESPYNTYKHRGLPPGPIRIASKRGIEAVLSAPEHEYLYMCAKEDFSGYHNFASDYATHQRNAEAYQAELNKRNIH